MATPQTVLVVDSGGHPLEPVAQRLRLLGIPVTRAKTGAEAHAALVDPRLSIGAVLVPADLPTLDPARAFAALSTNAEGRALPLLVSGPRPDADTRARLREVGARLALWEPIDDHALRFQVNRAFSEDGNGRPPRRSPRTPTSWVVEVRMGNRARSAQVYSVSSRGAFLAMPGPALRGSLVHLTLPLASRDADTLRVAGEVVLTNVPGNLRRRNLPLGMGVRFVGLGPNAERALSGYTEERALDLVV